jgi:hypothetical protein
LKSTALNHPSAQDATGDIITYHVSSISRETFLAILDTTLPRTFTLPFDA